MISVRGCPRAVSSTLAALLFLFLVLLVFRSKALYEGFQKANRLNSYEKYMEEITELLEQAEEGAEFGKEQLHALDTVVDSLDAAGGGGAVPARDFAGGLTPQAMENETIANSKRAH